jgi:hypothetical protein
MADTYRNCVELLDELGKAIKEAHPEWKFGPKQVAFFEFCTQTEPLVWSGLDEEKDVLCACKRTFLIFRDKVDSFGRRL